MPAYIPYISCIEHINNKSNVFSSEFEEILIL